MMSSASAAGRAAAEAVGQVRQPVQVQGPGQRGHRDDGEHGAEQRPGVPVPLGTEQHRGCGPAEHQRRWPGRRSWPGPACRDGRWRFATGRRPRAGGSSVISRGGSGPGDSRAVGPGPRTARPGAGALGPRSSRLSARRAGDAAALRSAYRRRYGRILVHRGVPRRSPATGWRQVLRSALIESGVSAGATGWDMDRAPVGCRAGAWLRRRSAVGTVPRPARRPGRAGCRARPGERAAGLPGPWGGAAGASSPRRPRPVPSAGAVALDEPAREIVLDLRGTRRPVRAPTSPRPGDRRAARQPAAAPPLPPSCAASTPSVSASGPGTVQDGCMRDTRASAGGLRSAIERSGYYPGVVSDAVSAALGHEQVISYVVHHDALFDPGMEVRRHMTVLVLTPSQADLLAHGRAPRRRGRHPARRRRPAPRRCGSPRSRPWR